VYASGDLPVDFDFAIAIAAIHRTIIAGLEGHLSVLAAFCTGCRVHLSVATAGALTAFRLSGLTAGRATLGFVGIALGMEEFLLFCGEGERITAIGTLECFFLVTQLNDLLSSNSW
jgi:hypothetical protein